MGSFREQGRKGVGEISENSRKTLESGETMREQAEKINGIIESLNLKDSEDVSAMKETSDGYQQSFDTAYTEQIESASEQIEQQGEQLQNEMEAERQNVEKSKQALERAGTVSEIGSDVASKGAAKLEQSNNEYQQIINEADTVVKSTAEQVSNLKNNIGHVFRR